MIVSIDSVQHCYMSVVLLPYPVTDLNSHPITNIISLTVYRTLYHLGNILMNKEKYKRGLLHCEGAWKCPSCRLVHPIARAGY